MIPFFRLNHLEEGSTGQKLLPIKVCVSTCQSAGFPNITGRHQIPADDKGNGGERRAGDHFSNRCSNLILIIVR